jgi:hypothetical protein
MTLIVRGTYRNKRGTSKTNQAVNSVCCVLLASKTIFFDLIFLYFELGRAAGGDPNGSQMSGGPVGAIGAH